MPPRASVPRGRGRLATPMRSRPPIPLLLALLPLPAALGGCPTRAPEPASPAPASPSPAPAAPAAAGVPEAPVPSADDDLPLVLGMLGARTDREVEVVLDRGAFEGDDWLSEPVGADQLLTPTIRVVAGSGSLARGHGRLPFGPGLATVARVGCGPSVVPYRVGAVETVVLPYPTCAATDAAADQVITAGALRRVRSIAVLDPDPDAPVDDPDAPARWLRYDEAERYCAWLGLRLAPDAPRCVR